MQEYIVKKNGEPIAHSTAFTFDAETDVMEVSSLESSDDKDFIPVRTTWKVKNSTLISTSDSLHEDDEVDIVVRWLGMVVGGRTICKSHKVDAQRGSICKGRVVFQGTGMLSHIFEPLIWNEGTWDDFVWA